MFCMNMLDSNSILRILYVFFCLAFVFARFSYRFIQSQGTFRPLIILHYVWMQPYLSPCHFLLVMAVLVECQVGVNLCACSIQTECQKVSFETKIGLLHWMSGVRNNYFLENLFVCIQQKSLYYTLQRTS